MTRSNKIPGLTTYYNIDDFFWDYWCFDMYTEEVYKEVMKNHNYGKPSPEVIECMRQSRQAAHDEKLRRAEKSRTFQNEKLNIGKLGQLPKNFKRFWPIDE